MTTAIYIRISDKDQNLEGQRAELTQWLERFGIQDAVWYEDIETGKHLKRPAFQQLEKDVRRGKVDTVVVWKLDRLARSMRDGVNLITDWIERDVRIVSVTQAIDISGVLGRMIAGILFAFAEMELSVLKERQAAGIAVAKAQGKYTGRKPGTTKGRPERAKALRAKGNQIAEIAAALGVTERTVANYLKA